MKTIRVVLAVTGLAAIGYAVAGAAADPGVEPVGHLGFLATVLIGHDLVLLPIALGVGALIARYAPSWARGPAQGGLFASAVLTLVALPFLVGAGRSADNPSVLPLDYRRGLLVVLGVVWVVAALAAARNAYAGRRAERRTPPTPRSP